MTHFSGEPLAAHTIDHRLTMVDLFCCTGTIAGQVPAAGSEVLSRVNASGREVLTRVTHLFSRKNKDADFLTTQFVVVSLCIAPHS
ncbi:hypothetical protein MWO63_002557 [Salmonella enterica subsp. enterica serovar Infantis]|nr:hypothetical protein [Escherichia coli]EIU9104014.1 hypothetical protein [Salmonella enterica]EJA2029050.1 hypothetical protein [Salmonella enterica subsp. enterica serovar Infantis]EJB3929567.1 hypothetical protein [Salmonella enterica subsp. enterica serovar Infantis]EKL8325923.1 hypothetical protein [Escherichia coli]